VTIVDVAVLFPGFGSEPAALTVAVLETVPGVDEVFTTMLIVALPLLVNIPRAQETVDDVLLHDPCDGVAETNVVAAGRVSVTTTLLAALGPLLATLIM
jgi:hypothetical protein